MTWFFENISLNPIIASVNNLDNLEYALNSPCENIFLLTGNIFNLKDISQRVLDKGKGLYIYVDAIDGFSKDTWGLEYIVKNIALHGIITRKSNLVKLSKDMGVFTIERLLIHDSNTLMQGLDSVNTIRPHAIEILPGIIPKIIEKINTETKLPIIASGLILNKEDIALSLGAGAIGITSTNKETWYLNY